MTVFKSWSEIHRITRTRRAEWQRQEIQHEKWYAGLDSALLRAAAAILSYMSSTSACGVHPHAHAIRLAFEEAERAKTRSGYDAGVFQMHVAGKKLTFAGTELERKHQKERLCRSNSGPPSVRCVVPRHKSSILDLGALFAHPPISEEEFLTMYILSSLCSWFFC